MDDHADDAALEAQPVDSRVATVLRLATTLSDQVLDAQIMKRLVPTGQIRALANAALLLNEHSVPLPPLLMQVLHEVGATGLAAAVAGGESVDRADSQSIESERAKNLAWLLRPFQGQK